MDKIALRKLVEAGVKRARAAESVEGPDCVQDDITVLCSTASSKRVS